LVLFHLAVVVSDACDRKARRFPCSDTLHVKNYQQYFLKKAGVLFLNSGELYKFLHPKDIN